ncbi:lysophospholipid acyltransferase family protein [soil metagenome]
MPANVRRWARIGALLLLLMACVPPHVFMRLLTGNSSWPRRFLGAAGWLCGVRVRMTGQRLTRDVFFIANHVSWIDILALGGATGAAFVSRDDVAGWPVVGWLARQNNTLFVSRAERGAVHGQIGQLRAAMERHQPVALFPEGTTSNGHALLPFKPPLFAVLLPPPRAIRVQPVLIDYGAATDEIAWVDDEPAGSNALRVLSRRGTIALTLHFLAPFDPGAHPDRKALAA